MAPTMWLVLKLLETEGRCVSSMDIISVDSLRSSPHFGSQSRLAGCIQCCAVIWTSVTFVAPRFSEMTSTCADESDGELKTHAVGRRKHLGPDPEMKRRSRHWQDGKHRLPDFEDLDMPDCFLDAGWLQQDLHRVVPERRVHHASRAPCRTEMVNAWRPAQAWKSLCRCRGCKRSVKTEWRR